MVQSDGLVERALRAEVRGRYGRAVSGFVEAAAGARPDDGRRMARLLARAGDLAARAEDADLAASLYRRAADTYAGENLLTLAVAVCRRALRTVPEDASFHVRLADLHLEVGLVTEARRHVLAYDEAADDGRPGTIDLDRLRSFLRRESDRDVAPRLAEQLDAAEAWRGFDRAAGPSDASRRDLQLETD